MIKDKNKVELERHRNFRFRVRELPDPELKTNIFAVETRSSITFGKKESSRDCQPDHDAQGQQGLIMDI